MTEAQENMRFKYLFWFAVGLVVIGASLSAYVLAIDKSHIDMILTFWLTSATAGAIGYQIGSSSNKGRPEGIPKPEAGQTQLSLDVTTGPTDKDTSLTLPDDRVTEAGKGEV